MAETDPTLPDYDQSGLLGLEEFYIPRGGDDNQATAPTRHSNEVVNRSERISSGGFEAQDGSNEWPVKTIKGLSWLAAAGLIAYSVTAVPDGLQSLQDEIDGAVSRFFTSEE